MPARRLGLIVNPVAGVGGPLGLKGTDASVLARFPEAPLHAPPRAVRFLRALPDDVEIWTVAGPMGEEEVHEADRSALVVFTPTEPSTGEDTTRAAEALADAGIDLLAFVGGDGTAADVLRGIDGRVVALGVPSGVKMYSAVFAETPEAAAKIVEAYDAEANAEVLDVDEDAFRKGELRVALRGVLRVPSHRTMQSGKLAGEDDEIEQETLAEAAAAFLSRHEGLWALGGGTTMAHVKRALRVDGSLLGVDLVRFRGTNAEMVVADATEEELLRVGPDLRILLSPIGGQGFVLGRGNTQITPKVLRNAGLDHVFVVATPTKLIATPRLHVDTGDAALDTAFPKYLRVITGHHSEKLVPVT